MYNLTESQQETLRWIVRKIRDGDLAEEFSCVFLTNGKFARFEGKGAGIAEEPPITEGILNALMASELILAEKREKYLIHCTLRKEAYQAVDTDFGEININDTSGAKHFSTKTAIGIVLFVIGVIITVVANVATQTLPEKLRPYFWLSWPLLFILVVVSVIVMRKQ